MRFFNYLSKDTDLMPADDWGRTMAMQWMFFEQCSHVPNIAALRFWVSTGQTDKFADQIETKMAKSHEVLAVMERQLQTADWFAGANY